MAARAHCSSTPQVHRYTRSRLLAHPAFIPHSANPPLPRPAASNTEHPAAGCSVFEAVWLDSSYTYSALCCGISMQMRLMLQSFGRGTGHLRALIGVVRYTRSSADTYACEMPHTLIPRFVLLMLIFVHSNPIRHYSIREQIPDASRGHISRDDLPTTYLRASHLLIQLAP